jgi:hypothetical protein
VGEKKSEGRRRGAVLESWSVSPRGGRVLFYRESANSASEPSALSSVLGGGFAITRPTWESEASRPSFQTACHSVLLRPTSSQSNFPSIHSLTPLAPHPL